jgi:hypothetical protein
MQVGYSIFRLNSNLIITNLSRFFSVIPAQAGIQAIRRIFLDSRLRGNDGGYVGW